MSGPEATDGARPRLVLITGMSGAGKSSVANCLEDLGFYCLDNLPLSLLAPLLEDPTGHVEGADRIAVVADVRTPGVADRLPELVEAMDRSRVDPFLLFLDTSDEVLVRRYSETRRRHPLSGEGPVIAGIEMERTMLEELRGRADRVLDTTDFTIHEIRAEVYREFSPELLARTPLTVSLVSFGFKRGIPYGSDMLFDVRFLPNPYFVEELRPLSGLDQPVRDFLERHDGFVDVVRRFGDLIEYLLPRFVAEHRSYLTVAVGCTGGRHRSVAVVERLAQRLRGADWTVRTLHRDVGQESLTDPR